MDKFVAPEKIYWQEAMVCHYIAKQKGITEIEALELFAKSKTHFMLLNEQMKMYFFSPEALFEIYKTEEETGDPRNSPYINEV